MAAAITLALLAYPKGIDNTQRCTYARGTVTISSGTYASGGIALNWQFDAGLKVGTTPFQVSFFSEGVKFSSVSSLIVGGYMYVWNSTNNKLQILTASGGAAGTGPVYEEMTNGTSVPAAVLNDTIAFEAVFVKSAAF